MLIAIIILLVIGDIGIGCIMLMVAALVTEEKPKTYEDAQKDLFKAWGDALIKEYEK